MYKKETTFTEKLAFAILKKRFDKIFNKKKEK